MPPKARNHIKVIDGLEYGIEKETDYVILLMGRVQVWVNYDEYNALSEMIWEANRA